MFHNKNRRRPPEAISVENVYFIGEQEGVSEKEFKDRVSAALQHVRYEMRLYLARVAYDLNMVEELNVALCVSPKNSLKRAHERKIQRIFGSMFNPTQHLDLIHVTLVQESHLSSVCSPFFEIKGKTKR